MSTTLNLKSVRFVKRVSNGASLSKYGYIGMMQANAAALETAPWIQSELNQGDVTLTTNKLTLTDGEINTETGEWITKPSYTAYLGDKYDVYNQAGDAVAQMATMCGYAGCVAYRFALPTSETANALQTVTLAMQRDRYLRAGVRISMCLSSSETPSNDWSVIRGTAAGCVRSESTTPGEGVTGVESFGFLGQPDVPNVTASRAADGTISFDTATAFADAASFPFLFVYLTLEDPAAYWGMYSATAKRQYYIEGSAMLVPDGCAFTYAAETAVATTELAVDYYTAAISVDPTTNLDVLPIGDVHDYRRHPWAATDVVGVSFCGGPIVCNVGGTLQIGMEGWSDPSKSYATQFLSLGPGDEYVAAKAAYEAFFADKMYRNARVKGESSIASYKPAAAWCFEVMPDSATYGEHNIAGLHRKKVLIPFFLQQGFRPKQVKLTWSQYESYANTSAPDFLALHNVWIAVGQNLGFAYGLQTIQKHELYTAETKKVGEFRLLGSEKYLVITRSTLPSPYTMLLDLPPLGHGPHTLLLTMYVELDQIPTFTFEDKQHLGMMFDGLNPTLYGNGYLLGYEGCFGGGWSPDISLIG